MFQHTKTQKILAVEIQRKSYVQVNETWINLQIKQTEKSESESRT
jgi:hypothetical protein